MQDILNLMIDGIVLFTIAHLAIAAVLPKHSQSIAEPAPIPTEEQTPPEPAKPVRCMAAESRAVYAELRIKDQPSSKQPETFTQSEIPATVRPMREFAGSHGIKWWRSPATGKAMQKDELLHALQSHPAYRAK